MWAWYKGTSDEKYLQSETAMFKHIGVPIESIEVEDV
jgi:hypothetical protein